MTRSEMIHLGANVLDHKLDIMSNYELVDAILTVFEKAGMLPPLNDIGDMQYNTSDRAALDMERVWDYHKWDIK